MVADSGFLKKADSQKMEVLNKLWFSLILLLYLIFYGIDCIRVHINNILMNFVEIKQNVTA